MQRVLSKGKMRVYIMPVSGSGFSAQIGILVAISLGFLENQQSGPKPEIALASSGGNIAAYLGLAGDWNYQRILTACRTLTGQAFLTGWADNIPSWLFMAIARSSYRPGYGADSIFNYLFTPERLRNGSTEIWTGVTSRNSLEHQICTNRSKENSILSPQPIISVGAKQGFGIQCIGDGSGGGVQLCINDSLTTRYLDGNISEIAKITIASASIPWVVKPVVFENDLLIDGGAMYASPLSVLQNNLIEVSQTKFNDTGEPLKLFYISSDVLCKCSKSTAFDLLTEISLLLASSRASDIRSFIHVFETLTGGTRSIPSHHDKLTPKELGNLIINLDATNQTYAVLLYPPNTKTRIDMTAVTPEKLVDKVSNAFKEVSAFVWIR